MKSIPSNAFSKCKSIYQIDIPSSVTSLGDNCFYECSSLERILIPSSVKYIGKGAFEKCHMIETIEIESEEEKESQITEINENTFKECESLITIIMPTTISKINKRAFEGYKMLNEIEQENLAKIYWRIFIFRMRKS